MPLILLHLGNNTLVVGQIWVAGKDEVDEVGSPPGGSTDQVVSGVATLE